MATPTTASKHPSGHPAAAAMTPNSFANHLAAPSPLPGSGGGRSQKSHKSPFNTTAIPPPFNHPSTGPSNPPLTFDSPSAGATLGLNLGNMATPSAHHGVTPAMGGAPLANVRGDEEERRRRVEAILQMLRTRPGRISEEGVERLAKRTGLDCYWDHSETGAKTLSIAGVGTFLVDVEFESNSVKRVALSFPTSSEAVSGTAAEASSILLKDLTPPSGEEGITSTLSAFADNLERLAKLDKLSAAEMNCFEAVSGVYSSLRKIFEHEKARSKEKNSTDAELVDKEVLCKKSGRPSLNAERRVGLSLQYWIEKRRILKNQATNGSAEHHEDDEDSPRTWSAVIECESSPAELYPSIRVSDEWISSTIEVEQPGNQGDVNDPIFGPSPPLLDWLEPPPTFLPVTNSQGDTAMAVDGGAAQTRLPDVRFVARLEPPVVVPLQIAYGIYNSVGIAIPQETLRPNTFDGLVLAPDTEQAPLVQGETKEVRRERPVVIIGDDGQPEERMVEFGLYAQKQDYGRVLDEIPFAHPRQVVALLPTLRQYAFLSHLLQTTFAPSEPSPSSAPSDPVPVKTTLSAFLSPTPTSPLPPDTPASVSVSLTTLPTPRLTLIFPLGARLAHITVEIGPNAAVGVVEQDVVVAGDGVQEQERAKRVEALGRALEVCEDLGVWVEWIRKREGGA